MFHVPTVPPHEGGARAFPKALWWTLPLGPHNLRAITVKEWGKRREHRDGHTQRSAQLTKRMFRRGFQVQGQQGCTMGATAPGMGGLKDSGGKTQVREAEGCNQTERSIVQSSLKAPSHASSLGPPVLPLE